MNRPTQTNPTSHAAAAAPLGFDIGDLYYLLFRHKWKIVLVFLAGIVGAIAFYLVKPPVYQSEAKVLIRFVLEARSTTSSSGVPGGDAQIKSPDSAGNNIINSEIEILTSFDLAGLVADAVGADKILAKLGGARGDGKDRVRAAGVISGGLSVEAPGRSSVLRIMFRHPDPAVVQPVLSALVDTYLKRHVEIHQGVGVMDEFFLRQTDQLRTRLSETEAQLKKLKADVRVISLDESKRGYIEQISQIQAALRTAETEMAERRTALESLAGSIPSTNAPSTNSVSEVKVPADVMERYRTAAAELESLVKRRSELRVRYFDEHFLVRSLNTQIDEAEATKRQLEAEHPSLVRFAQSAPAATNRAVDLPAEMLRVNTLAARIKVLTTQLDRVSADAGRVSEAEPAIAQLQRSLAVDEANYRFYLTRLQEARMDESLGAGKITNISLVQTPSPPSLDTKKLTKPLLMILAFGCFGGFAWGFVSDRFLNQTVNRVADVERDLPVPLFISVPDFSWRNGVRFLKSSRDAVSPPATTPIPEDGGSAEAPASTAVAPWDSGHKLRPYYEGLRDRLITYFEVRDMRHKPKMVAVTGCAHGSGVTTMAAGLAAALSETGDGKVLLVDMNLERGAAHPFYQGKPGCALSDALDDATREQAFVQDGLYLVSGKEQPKNQQLPSVLPKRFANLVPKMKASDYDYIIFDMPPVTQTSVTARLAGFMDMVLLVVESEKTGQKILKRTHGLLNESRPHMAAVLNKHRAYVPSKFTQEL